MKIRMLSLTAAVMLLSLPALPVGAADRFEVQELPDGTVAVTCSDTSITNAVIPDQIDGKAVTALAEHCFDGCASLAYVTFPAGLKEIGSYAFQGCMAMETVEIPATVETIGDFAFEGCISLTAITVEAGNPSYKDVDGVLYTADETLLLRYPAARDAQNYIVSSQTTDIAPWCFTDCQNLRKVDASMVTAIGADCFMGCPTLNTVLLPEHLEELIGAAFARCSKLRILDLPDSLKRIGDRCFYGCAELKSLELPDGLESIGEMAFYGCTGIHTLTVPGSTVTFGEKSIGYSVSTEGKDVLIPDFRISAPLGSKAAAYAKKNGIRCHKTMSKETGVYVLIGLLLTVLLLVGTVLSIQSARKQRQAEAAQLAEAERLKRVEALRAARKKK